MLEDPAQIKSFNFHDPTPIGLHVPLQVLKVKTQAQLAKEEREQAKADAKALR